MKGRDSLIEAVSAELNTLMTANNEQDWKMIISMAGQIHSLSEGSKEDIEAQKLLAIF